MLLFDDHTLDKEPKWRWAPDWKELARLAMHHGLDVCARAVQRYENKNAGTG